MKIVDILDKYKDGELGMAEAETLIKRLKRKKVNHESKCTT